MFIRHYLSNFFFKFNLRVVQFFILMINCPVGEPSCRLSVLSTNCPVGLLSCRQNVRSANCLSANCLLPLYPYSLPEVYTVEHISWNCGQIEELFSTELYVMSYGIFFVYTVEMQRFGAKFHAFAARFFNDMAK